MKIYRYEHKDGGGPFCFPNGALRTKTNCQMDNGYLYGCCSLEQLNEYFLNQKKLITNCTIKEYDVPDELVIIRKRQVLFPKTFSKTCIDYP